MTTTSTRSDLEGQHGRLVRIFAYIAARAAEGEERTCDAVWDIAAEALARHMADEDELFAELEGQSVERDETLGRLRADHQTLRRTLLDAGLLVQLHTASPGVLADLVRQLRAHAALEEATFYRWLAEPRPNAPAERPSSVRAGAAIGALTGVACGVGGGPLVMLGAAGAGAAVGAALAHELDEVDAAMVTER